MYKTMSHEGFTSLTGHQVVSIMRKGRVTIDQMAAANQLTKKRVRELRAKGVPGGLAAWEIHRMVEIAQGE